MTGWDLLMGVGHLDESLIDEALHAGESRAKTAARRALEACIGVVLIGGILAARSGGAPGRPGSGQIEHPEPDRDEYATQIIPDEAGECSQDGFLQKYRMLLSAPEPVWDDPTGGGIRTNQESDMSGEAPVGTDHSTARPSHPFSGLHG